MSKEPAVAKAAVREQSAAELESMSLLDQIIEEHSDTARRYLPVMSPQLAQARKVSLVRLKELVLKETIDYGKPPGTDRPDARDVLLKPGAEKICAYFGYAATYDLVQGTIEDWTGDDHKGEPLFYYHVTCSLTKDGVLVGSGNGSCSSWESKYRYRMAGRACPSCERTDTLIKGKAEWEKDPEFKRRGSWICYANKGGCGAKYYGDDPAIMGQHVGSVANDRVFDLVNTVRKMADKRALIAAVLVSTGASEYFTQDLDDMGDATGVVQGTKEDQQRVAQQKIEEAKKAAEAARKAAAAASSKANASKPQPQAQSLPAGTTPPAGATPPKPRVTGAKAEDPDELKSTMFHFTGGDETKRAAIAKQLLDMLKSKDATAEGEAILQQFNCDFPTNLPELADQQECVRALWLAVARVWE